MPADVEKARDAAMEHLKGGPAFVMIAAAHPDGDGAVTGGRFIAGEMNSEDLLHMLATVASSLQVFLTDTLKQVFDANPPEARPRLLALFVESMREQKNQPDEPGDYKRMFSQWRTD